jgi:hypothetical protein
VVALVGSVSAQAAAETEIELRQQLDAQKAINEQLRRRVEELEGQHTLVPPVHSLRILEQRPSALDPETPEQTTAIEEALIARRLALLPAGSLRVAPGFGWAHSGASALNTRSENYTASLTLQAGLPFGLMLTANAPYTHRSTPSGSNSGPGDLFLSLTKQVANESHDMPSLVTSIDYYANTGKDPLTPIPIGFGFPALGGSILGLKRVDPLALYASVSYLHPFARDVSASNFLGESSFTGRIAPGDTWGYRLGVSLAATPEITLDTSLSGAFIGGTNVDSNSRGNFKPPNSTLGFFNLGAGFVLSKRLSLLVNASAGVTEASPDLALSVSLPYRF